MAQVTRAASAADYRRFAAECLHLAERYPISKATLIAMAAAWQRMAEFADEWRLWSRSRMIWIIPDSKGLVSSLHEPVLNDHLSYPPLA